MVFNTKIFCFSEKDIISDISKCETQAFVGEIIDDIYNKSTQLFDPLSNSKKTSKKSGSKLPSIVVDNIDNGKNIFRAISLAELIYFQIFPDFHNQPTQAFNPKKYTSTVTTKNLTANKEPESTLNPDISESKNNYFI